MAKDSGRDEYGNGGKHILQNAIESSRKDFEICNLQVFTKRM